MTLKNCQFFISFYDLYRMTKIHLHNVKLIPGGRRGHKI